MSLLCWLPMTDGTVKNNGVSNVQPTNYGAVVNNAGKLGKCYQFGTSSTYIDIPSSVMSNISDECSVCFWLNIISWNTSYATYFQAGTANTAWGNYIFGFLRIGGSNRCCFTISNGSTASNSDYTTPSLELNTWYHITLVYKSDHCLIYINGELYEDYSTSIVPNFSKITRITIGKGNNRTNYQSNCLMNDFRIYDRTLSPEEIHTLSLGLVAHYPLTLTTDEILGDVIEDNETFLVRKAIANKRGMFDEIVGGTVAWNQLLDQSGSITKAFQGSAAYYGNMPTSLGHNVALVSGHKYFIGVKVTRTIATNNLITIGILKPTNTVPRVAFADGSPDGWGYNIMASSVNATGDKLTYTNYLGKNGFESGDSITVERSVLFDLTQMFGTTIADYIYSLETATAGAGVAFFRKLFPKDYYPYDAGTLKSVEGLSAHTMVGFNQWDEEWELGYYNTSTGEKVSGTSNMRCKNRIPVIPNTAYYMQWNNANSAYVNIQRYDKNGNFVSNSVGTSPSIVSIAENIGFITFYMTSGYGTTYNHDICINLFDPSRNGEYEPYVKHSYALDDSLTLRGVPKLDASNNLYYDGDVYASDGTVTRRYGIVDLGTLTWEYAGSEGNMYFATYLSGGATRQGATEPFYACSKYLAVAPRVSSGLEDKQICRTTNAQSRFFIKDSAYSDAATFKTAMNGVYLVYELATPTTEASTKFTNPQIYEPDGIEMYTTTGVIPPGHQTKYVDSLTEGGSYTYNDYISHLGVGDGIVYDVSGHQYNGETSGTLSIDYNSPKYNMGMVFNGTDSYIEADPLPAETKTVSVWMKSSSIPSGNYVVFADINSGLALGYNSSKRFIVNAKTAGSSDIPMFLFGDLYILDGWNHVAIVKNSSSSYTVYLNGTTLTINQNNYWVHSINKLVIGCRNNGSYNGYFNGQLSDFRAYATALSADDVLALYNNRRPYMGLYTFDGNSAGIRTDWNTANIGTGDFTISAWVKITTSSKTYQPIISNKSTGANSVGCAIYFNHSQNKFLWSTASGSSAKEIWTAQTFSDIYDTWTHVVMVRNSSDPKIGYFYINGVRKELASVPTALNISTTNQLVIGGINTDVADYRWTGNISDVRFYEKALSEQQILRLYNNSSP